ncbi:PaaI family thioesterase [Maribius pontilimi]|uniref:PaaI family thioesterase n=1 Tax=Palleronia pontilimi TaxID=1964209 RepID=A0A934M8D2_9RHOB|nr:PaaI family thioesterase [Palleronia pontilimi]MBJ3761267.1 PaaI family thioesterase [Palleronia pontilimi]
MMRTLGATLADLGDGFAMIEAPILPGSRQQQGFGHAGLTFAIGDSAAGYAALTLMDDGQDVLTTEMKINLLRPAAGDLLIAKGEVVKPGRRITIVRATVWARTGDAMSEIAILQGTMLPV